VRLLALAAIAAVLIVVVALFLPTPEPPTTPPRLHAGYAGSASCKECHAGIYNAWKASAHASALAPANPETVKGEFVGVEPVTFNQLLSQPNAWKDSVILTDGTELEGVIVSQSQEEVILQTAERDLSIPRADVAKIQTAAQKQQEYDAGPRTESPYSITVVEPSTLLEGPRTEKHRVDYTLGAGRQTQQYVTKLPDGRLQVLPLVWDSQKNLWYDSRRLLPNPLEVGPESSYYWRGLEQTANNTCLRCHASQLEVNYNPRNDTFATTWAEPGVNCEACHGPAAQHIDIVRKARASGRKPTGWGITSLKSLSSDARTAICAQCHSLHSVQVPELKPGENYYDHFVPRLWDYQGRYRADGTPTEQNYQYLSLLSSQCAHASNLTCSDCHDPHGKGLSLAEMRLPKSDELCTRCHKDIAADLAKHTHHRVESSGSRCTNCHMPRIDIRMGRHTTDHRITSPTPASTVVLEIPNACNNCHRTETPEWANIHFTAWHGKEDPNESYLRAFIVDRLTRGDPRMLASGLELLRQPKASPPLRAMVAVLASRFPGARVQEAVAAALHDPHPLVQVAAISSLSGSWVAENLPIVAAKLTADVLAVRLAAAERFLDHPELIGRLESPEQRRDLSRVLREEAFPSVARNRDRPEAATELGRIRRVLGQRGLAARDYRLVLEKRPDFAPARRALAHFYLDQQRYEEALDEFDRLTSADQQDYDAHVSKARCLMALGRTDEAVEILEDVVDRAPRHVPARVQLGRAYLTRGQTEKAREELLQALKLEPQNETARRLLRQQLSPKR